MSEIKAPPIYRIRVKRGFHIDSAKPWERYYLDELKVVGIFRKRHEWRPVKVYHFDFGGGSREPASGNREWAQRIANEFGLEMPK